MILNTIKRTNKFHIPNPVSSQKEKRSPTGYRGRSIYLFKCEESNLTNKLK